jgi:hypothetical protein
MRMAPLALRERLNIGAQVLAQEWPTAEQAHEDARKFGTEGDPT